MNKKELRWASAAFGLATIILQIVGKSEAAFSMLAMAWLLAMFASGTGKA